ncbi:28268_t:CDS:1 [Dentiscutata erythropus]|uniref:28268_t:CDS:1 n=1 Tax=Dentiscutata erythropus TaxID=1348616 RepID=A0A9N9BQ66_9GLOM|nr:28268_t:CDS:1 [Dentiscutata erythropus]
MSFLCQERQQRGPYVTKACTNCQKKHAKCTGGAVCKRCTQRNLECTFIDSGKKRGPKKNDKHSEQVYALNGPENDFDGTLMLYSDPENEIDRTSMLSSGPEIEIDEISMLPSGPVNDFDGISMLSSGPANDFDETSMLSSSSGNEYYGTFMLFSGPENEFDGISMLSSVTPNPEQGHTSTLLFSSGNLQRQLDNFDDFALYPDFYVSQELSPFS